MRLKKTFVLIFTISLLFFTGKVNALTPSATNSGIPNDSLKATLTQKRIDLQQKLQAVQDQNKQDLILRISDKIANINEHATGMMTFAIEKMKVVLASLTQKTGIAKDSGLDVSSVEQAIASAEASLKIAEKAVASQSAKVYTIDASDSASLRGVVGKTVSELQSDLRQVHALVVDAKQNIAKVIMELAKTGAGRIGQKDKEASAPPALYKPFYPR